MDISLITRLLIKNWEVNKINNETSKERGENQVKSVKREWSAPQLKTFGTVIEITQHGRCKHGRPNPCHICAPKPCPLS